MEIIDREKENAREVKPESKFRFNGRERETRKRKRKKRLHMVR